MQALILGGVIGAMAGIMSGVATDNVAPSDFATDTTFFVYTVLLIGADSALRTTEWTDVYVARGTAAPVNVSACQGVNCSAPALSSDGRQIAYVKAQ